VSSGGTSPSSSPARRARFVAGDEVARPLQPEPHLFESLFTRARAQSGRHRERFDDDDERFDDDDERFDDDDERFDDDDERFDDDDDLARGSGAWCF
jgi:hypothetical protein